MFGSHLSIAGGLHEALCEARRLRLDCVQVFTRNQRQWSAPKLTRQQVDVWNLRRRRTPIQAVVSHASYLINLASPGGVTRRRSLSLFRDEIERCEALAIPWLVIHPGAHLGGGEAQGLRRIVAALDHVHRDLPGYRTVTCLEVTAGQGTSLGHRFEHLRHILAAAQHPERLAVCIDTAHLLAAGYDLTSAAGMRAVIAELEAVVGLQRVQVVHVNDSQTPRASRVDRHAHIGKGHVSRESFRELVNHPRFQAVPKILETPKGRTPGGRNLDSINLGILRRMVRPVPAGGA